METGAGRIRALRREDIPSLVALRQQVFRFSERADAAALARYFETVFFANPWTDLGLSSLVYADAGGEIGGFLGVIPRRMTFRGEPIRVAVATQLMVAPGRRGGLIGRRLARAFISGPQDLSLSDTANDAARRLWESVGGRTSLLLSMAWTYPLRPLRYALTRRARGPLGRGLAAALRPVCAGLDALLARRRGGVLAGPPPLGAAQAVDASELRAQLDGVAVSAALRPVYQDGSLDWLLRQASAKRQFGELQRVVTRGADGRVAGWFLYYVARGGVAQVVQLVAPPARQELVFEYLCRDARRRGATAVSGRVDPALMPILSSRGCQVSREGPWVLLHSPRPELLLAIERGDALLSRLEGEWWLSF